MCDNPYFCGITPLTIYDEAIQETFADVPGTRDLCHGHGHLFRAAQSGDVGHREDGRRGGGLCAGIGPVDSHAVPREAASQTR